MAPSAHTDPWGLYGRIQTPGVRVGSEDIKKARTYVWRLLNVRDRSARELLGRLRQKGYSEDISRALVDEFQGRGLVNDNRFAERWALERLRRGGRSLSVIRRELMKKGIARPVIEEVISGVEQQHGEDEIALEAARKKLRQVKKGTPEQVRKKLYEFLLRHGFDHETAHQAVCRVLEEE